MTITFYCTCGQHVSADQADAGRRAICPRCRQPVVVPSMKAPAPVILERPPLSVQTIKPISPFADPEPVSIAVPKSIGYQVVLVDETCSVPIGFPKQGYPLKKEEPVAESRDVDRELEEILGHRQMQRLRRPWYRRPRPQIERNGLECMAYPFRAFGLVSVLAISLTISSLLNLILLFTDFDVLDYGQLFFWGVLGLATFGYLCGFLHCTLQAGATGDAARVRWPGADIRLVLRSVAAVAISFLAGPIVFALAALWFWLQAGELTWLDSLLLWEQGLAAFLLWLLVYTSVLVNDRLSAVSPAGVLDVAVRLGWRLLPIGLSASLIFFVHACWILFVLETRVNEPAAGFMLLLFFWGSFLSCLTFLVRWLGVSWYHRNRQLEATKETPPAASLAPQGQ
ncbi:MAG: hypothetical protein FJ271_26035 [Planctomycetes bacterium]|nr:hypothetical protein [Planctomycetota bacterium]